MRDNIIADLTEYAKENNITLYLFGSYSRGTQKSTSDLDVFIEYEGESFSDIMNHTQRLRSFVTTKYGLDVDLVFSTLVDDVLPKYIKQKGLELWKAI